MGKILGDTGPSLGPFLSTLCIVIDPASYEPEVFFKSLFVKECGLPLQNKPISMQGHLGLNVKEWMSLMP